MARIGRYNEEINFYICHLCDMRLRYARGVPIFRYEKVGGITETAAREIGVRVRDEVSEVRILVGVRTVRSRIL